MKATPVLDLQAKALPAPQKRLLDEYSHLQDSGEKGGWRELARRREINVRYVYYFALQGKLPQNRSIRKKLLSRPREIPKEPPRRVLTGAWRKGRRWVSPEEYFGAKP